jgi:hypothetical protein
MITGSGQHSPWGNHGHTLDEAFYGEKRMQLDANKMASTLRGMQTPAFQLTMPPRAKTAPVATSNSTFTTLTLPPRNAATPEGSSTDRLALPTANKTGNAGGEVVVIVR